LSHEISVCRLAFLDDMARRMIDLGQFDRGIGHVATAAVTDCAFSAEA
jgi:hypothetical protein